MITHTNSFKNLKNEMQEIFDFAVAVSYAIPSLKINIKQVKEGTLPHLQKADYFIDTSTPEQIRKRTFNYQKKMARYILIASFSFFEAYVKNAIQEIFDYHGGNDELIKSTKNRINKTITNDDAKLLFSKKKLQDSFKIKNRDKYIKHTKVLHEYRFTFPSYLFVTYGIKQAIELTSLLRAKDIPDVISDILHIDLEDNEKNLFHSIRNIRNKIAHGERTDFSLNKVMEINDFLRTLAVKIDTQIVGNYLIIEQYA